MNGTVVQTEGQRVNGESRAVCVPSQACDAGSIPAGSANYASDCYTIAD